jgi:carotenoid cleavage dioxygenase
MVHDFLVTRGHVLFPVLPLTGSLERAMRGAPPFAWEPEKGSFVGVMARDASVDTIRWFQTDPCYVFHPMNAWEEGRKIFADVMEYPVAPLFPKTDGTPVERTRARLVRWTFDLASASNDIGKEELDDTPGEFPRFDERHAGLAYRHGWFAASPRNPGGTGFDSLAHIDLKTGARTLFQLPEGDLTGEPVFVPRKAGAAEGDGWLVCLIYRHGEDQTDFAVFEAGDIAAGPVGTARIPRRVPHGFHGNWRAA